MHEHLLNNYGELRKALGENARIQKMRGASLRLGGVDRSSADHLLIIGDAAGQTDPLTGEGIHTSIEAAAIAATCWARHFAPTISARDSWPAIIPAGKPPSAAISAGRPGWPGSSARSPSLLDGAAALVRRRARFPARLGRDDDGSQTEIRLPAAGLRASRCSAKSRASGFHEGSRDRRRIRRSQ